MVAPSRGQLDAAPGEPALLAVIFASPDPEPLARFEPVDANDTVSFASTGFVTAVTVNVPLRADKPPVSPVTVTRSLIANVCPSAIKVATLLVRLAELIVHDGVSDPLLADAPAVPAALSVAPPPPPPPAAMNWMTSFFVTTDAAPPPPPPAAHPEAPFVAPDAPLKSPPG